MAVITEEARLITRNDISANWAATNPVMLKGEFGWDWTANKFKIGDGVATWNELQFVELGTATIVNTVSPGTTDNGYALSQSWLNSTNGKFFILVGGSGGSAVWKEILNADDLANTMIAFAVAGTRANITSGDTIAVMFGKIAKMYTDLAAGLGFSTSIGTANFDAALTTAFNNKLTKNGAITAATKTKITYDANGLVTAGANATAADIGNVAAGGISGVTVQAALNELDTDKQAKITGALADILAALLTANRALISDANGKLAVSPITSTELGYLAGVTGGIQGQIDSIPKYIYKTGLNASTTDTNFANQTNINAVVIPVIQAAYTAPVKWWAVTVAVTFTPSDRRRDMLYYYDGTAWVYLYDLSTAINRANGTTAGIVENSTDITFTDGQGVVNNAAKVAQKLTAGGKTFDGSAAVTLTAADLGALTSVGALNIKNGAATLGTYNGAAKDIDLALDSSDLSDNATIVKTTDTLILDGGHA